MDIITFPADKSNDSNHEYIKLQKKDKDSPPGQDIHKTLIKTQQLRKKPKP